MAPEPTPPHPVVAVAELLAAYANTNRRFARFRKPISPINFVPAARTIVAYLRNT